MPCRFASSGTVATSRSASRAILALNVASNFLRDLVISVLHRLRQSRTLHTLTFGPISGVHFNFALSFELWRRVRRLPTGKLFSDKYWFAFETRDMVGRTYSFLFALAPLLFGILIYVLFAISQGLGLVIFGRVLTIPGLLTLSFPIAPGPGWRTTNYFAFRSEEH